MNAQQKQRAKQRIKTCLLWLTAGLVYYAFVRLTGWGLPCLLTKITGGLCPGCGITRMFMALFEGNLPLAARNNLLVLCLLPVGAVYGAWRSIRYIKTGDTRSTTVELIFLLIVFAATVAFWILRNQPQFSFLAPV